MQSNSSSYQVQGEIPTSIWQAFVEKGSIISKAPKGSLVTQKYPQQANQAQPKSLDVNLNHDVHWGKKWPFM